jgi:hypothetical protein
MISHPTNVDAARVQLFQEHDNAYRQREYHPHFLQQLDPQQYHIGGHDHPYNTTQPQQIFMDNGDGSLFSVGIARPGDFDQYGNICGPRPSPHQSTIGNSIQRRSKPPPYREPNSNLPNPPIYTQDQHYQGQPSPQQET